MISPIPALLLCAAAEAFAVLRLLPLPPNTSFSLILAGTIAANSVLYFTYHVLVYPFFLSPLRHLPQPSGSLPLLGHGLAVFKKPPAVDFLKWVTDVPNNGLIYFRGFFYQDRLMLTTPESISEVLVHKTYDFEKPAKVVSFLRLVLGDGLILVEGDVHRFQRKHIMPAFQFRRIKEMYPTMWRKSVTMTEVVNTKLQEDARASQNPTNIVEINHFANKVTLDIIGVAGLGRELGALGDSNHELVRHYEKLLEPTLEMVIYFALQVMGPAKLIRKIPLGINKMFHKTTSELRRITTELVQDKKTVTKTHIDESTDILSILIKSGDFSERELVDQMLTFLAAGHETTSSAFTWSTYLLAKHPDIQKQLREELKTALPSGLASSDVDLATILESLPMLNGVCNEVSRLYPTVPMTIRQACRPTKIMDTYVPKGTEVIISPWAVNRSPHLWGPQASEFLPERWISADGTPNNNGGAPSNYAFLTFLHGPRSCIGASFAKAELRCLVAAFVMAFHIEYAHPGKEAIPAGVVTTKPRDGMDLKLTPLTQ